MDDLDRAQVATDEMLSDILKMRKPSIRQGGDS